MTLSPDDGLVLDLGAARRGGEDIDRSGIVDFGDILMLLEVFGRECDW